jgi:subtilisin family serine protease
MPQKYVLLSSGNIWNRETPGAEVAFLALASRRVLGDVTPEGGKPWPPVGGTTAPLDSDEDFTPRPSSRYQEEGPVSLAFGSGEGRQELKILDSLGEAEPTLVTLSDEQRLALHRAYPGLRISPVAELRPLWIRRRLTMPAAALSANGPAVRTTIQVTVKDRVTGAPISGVLVQAVRDWSKGWGVENRTNPQGKCTLRFRGSIANLEFLSAEASQGYWARYVPKVKIADNAGEFEVELEPIALAGLADGRHFFHAPAGMADGKGVRVGVVDSGVTPGDSLRVAGGANLVAGEDPLDYQDNGLGHGTHVAGIIAAGSARAGEGPLGIAPGVELYAYRVFAKDAEMAESFTIAKAIQQAVDDGCDLINLSLGVDKDVPEIYREIQRARSLGVVCFAASGNDYREEVAYPARYATVLAVSATGRKGTYPKNAVSPQTQTTKPVGTDRKNYLAGFSNAGIETDLTGAGVAIVSTYPGGYAVMSGTSMAAPAITGAVARLLAKETRILTAARDQERSDAIVALALRSAVSLGFGPEFEGAGLVR